MTINKNKAIAQNVESLIEAGHYVLARVGTCDVSGQTTELVPLIFVAPRACYVKSAKMVSLLALAANDTNYVTITIKNVTQTTEMATTAPTTKATGGTAFVANTAWDLTIDQENTLAADDVLQLSITPSTNSVANDLTDVIVALEITFDEGDEL